MTYVVHTGSLNIDLPVFDSYCSDHITLTLSSAEVIYANQTTSSISSVSQLEENYGMRLDPSTNTLEIDSDDETLNDAIFELLIYSEDLTEPVE